MDRSSPLRQLGFEAHDFKRFGVTIEALRKYLAIHSDDFPTQWRYADALHDVGRFKDAIAAFKIALRLARPTCRYSILGQLGNVEKSRGRYATAERYFRRALRAPGGSTRGSLWIFRGANFAGWGKLKAAHRCYRTALMLDCARDEAYLNLGYIYRAEGRYGEAIRCFQRALAIDPEYQLAQSALLSLEGFDELSAMAEDFS